MGCTDSINQLSAECGFRIFKKSTKLSIFQSIFLKFPSKKKFTADMVPAVGNSPVACFATCASVCVKRCMPVFFFSSRFVRVIRKGE